MNCFGNKFVIFTFVLFGAFSRCSYQFLTIIALFRWDNANSLGCSLIFDFILSLFAIVCIVHSPLSLNPIGLPVATFFEQINYFQHFSTVSICFLSFQLGFLVDYLHLFLKKHLRISMFLFDKLSAISMGKVTMKNGVQFCRDFVWLY